MKPEPRLSFTEEELLPLVTRLYTSHTLIVTDDYNYPLLHQVGTVVLAKDQEFEHIESVKRGHVYSRVIAVGGCTALDFGRAAAVGKQLIVVPTILSNSCISVNRSVIKRDGIYKSEETIAPEETIISMPTITNNHAHHVKNWSASGCGDLFSGISASIELEYIKNNKSLKNIHAKDVIRNVPMCMHALNWAAHDLTEFDRHALELLAHYLHESCLEVIRNGHAQLSAASEHWLYYKMQERKQFNKSISTHGKMVSIGNLITTRIFAEETGDFTLYNEMRNAHKKTGLPLTYGDLSNIQLSKVDLMQGIAGLDTKDCLYSDYFSSRDYSVLDRIYS